MKTEVEKFTENGAVFVDGTELEDIDVLILATGFNYSFSFIQKDVIRKEREFLLLSDLVWPADLEPATLAILVSYNLLEVSLQLMKCKRDGPLEYSVETVSFQVLRKDYRWWKNTTRD